MRDQCAKLLRAGEHSALLARDAPLRERLATARARRAILRAQLDLLGRTMGQEEGELGGLRKRNAQMRRSIGKLSDFRDRQQAEPPSADLNLGSGGGLGSQGGGSSSRLSLLTPQRVYGASACGDDPERRAWLFDKRVALRAAQRRAVARRAAQAEEGRAKVAAREAAGAAAPPPEAAAPLPPTVALLLHSLIAEVEIAPRFKVEAATAARHIIQHSCWPTLPACCATPTDGARPWSPRASSPRPVAAPRRRATSFASLDITALGVGAGAGAAGGCKPRSAATARPATAPFRSTLTTRRPRFLAAGVAESLCGSRPAATTAATAAAATAIAAAAHAAVAVRPDGACTVAPWRPNTPPSAPPPPPQPMRPATVDSPRAGAGWSVSASPRVLLPTQVVLKHGSQPAASSDQVRMIVRGLYN